MICLALVNITITEREIILKVFFKTQHVPLSEITKISATLNITRGWGNYDHRNNPAGAHLFLASEKENLIDLQNMFSKKNMVLIIKNLLKKNPSIVLNDKATALLTSSSPRQYLRATRGDEDGVLKMGRGFAVGGAVGPFIGI